MSSLIANAFTDSGRVIGYSGTGKKKLCVMPLEILL